MFGGCADVQLLIRRLPGARAAVPVLRRAAQWLGLELRADGDCPTLVLDELCKCYRSLPVRT